MLDVNTRLRDEAANTVLDSMHFFRPMPPPVEHSQEEVGKGLLECDVVIPYCADDLQYVEGCVNAILSQTGVRCHLHLVADGLHPEKDPHLSTYSDCPQVSKYYTKESRGPYPIYNMLFHRYRTEFIAIQDVDDTPLPHRLMTSLQSLISFRADLFGAGIRQIVHEGEQDELLLKQLARCPIRYSKESLDEEKPDLAHLIHTTLVMRKEAFQAVNGYRSEWKTSADCDLVCRSYYAGLKWAVSNEIVSLRLLHSASITHTVPTSKSKGNKEEIRRSACLIRQKKRTPAEFGRLQQDWDSPNLVQTRVKQHRVHMTYDVKGWAYYHRCQSLSQRAPSRYRVSCSDGPATEKVDITLTNNYTRLPFELEALRRNSDNIIVSHNADNRRCLAVLRHNLMVADLVIGKSHSLSTHNPGYGRLEIVPTGYEPRIFHPQGDLLSRPPKCCGSPAAPRWNSKASV